MEKNKQTNKKTTNKNTEIKKTTNKKATNETTNKKTTNNEKKSEIKKDTAKITKKNEKKVTEEKIVEIKKEKKKNEPEISKKELLTKKDLSTDDEIKIGNLFKIILIIIVIFGLFYVITYYGEKNKKLKASASDPKNTYVEIQYDEILVGSTLNQKEDEYYVLISKEDNYKKFYKSISTTINNKKRLYYSFIDNGLNSKYITKEESNLNVKNIEDLKINKDTLLKINNHEITESVEGTENIMNKFVEINK
jgi:hypothetical protein